MPPFNRKDLSVIVVVLLLALAGGVYYWFKVRLPSGPTPEAIKNQCLGEMENATDGELIQEVQNLVYPEEIDPISGENRITAAHRNIISYFICKAQYNKDEEFYNLAKSYFEGMNVVVAENKQKALADLEKSYSAPIEKTSNDILLSMTFGDFNEICPEKLPKECREITIPRFEKKVDKSLLSSFCDKICALIYDADNINDDFKSDVLEMKRNRLENEPEELFKSSLLERLEGEPDELGDEIQILKTIDLLEKRDFVVLWRIGLAYRAGGEEMALRICEGFDDEEACENFVKDEIKYLEGAKSDDAESLEIKYGCDIFKKNLEGIICDF